MIQLQALLQELPTTSPTLRGLFGIAVVVVGWGGWRSLKLVLPILDDVWMGSFTRNADRVEQHLRGKTFHDDIQMRTELHELARATAQSCAQNADAIRALLEEREQDRREQRDSATQLIEGLSELNGEVKFLAGQVELLARDRGLLATRPMPVVS